MKSKKTNLKHIMRWVLMIIAVVSMVLLTLCSLSVYVNPVDYHYVTPFCLLFPLWLILSLTSVLGVLLFNRRLSLLLIVVLCFNLPSIFNYCPLNISGLFSEEIEHRDLKVMSFNVQGFALSEKGERSLAAFRQFFDTCSADIVCFQEGSFKKVVDSCLISPSKRNYPYFMKNKGVYWHSWVGVFSKYPVLSYEMIDTTGNNICCAFKVLLSVGDTLTIVNAHMPSLRLSPEERHLLKDALGISPGVATRSGFYSLVSSVCAAGILRSRQVENICDYLQRHREENILLMGDFNDTPVSYAHQRVSNYLRDCFRSSGCGVGRTFNKDALYVRIDHIFASDFWEPILCRIMDDVHLSDHYPIVCTLRRVDKKQR